VRPSCAGARNAIVEDDFQKTGGHAQASLKSKSELAFRFFDDLYFCTGATRFFFLISSPGMLVLRASCFTRRLCLAIPWEGRLRLVLGVAGVVSNLCYSFIFALNDGIRRFKAAHFRCLDA
jgi:hypothetical protein